MIGFGKAVLLGMTAMATSVAAAQGAPPVDPNAGLAAGTADTAPGDIIVTARKIAERLQDVPVAITAFTAADIKSARIESIADVAKLTAGLNFTPLFGRQNQLPIIRGAAQTLGPLNVGVFLDGIFLTGKASVDLALNDLERIEVVEGPQSALYGRNTFAGAINYITKRPSDTLGGEIEGTIGQNGLYKVLGSISGPLSDKVRFRVGGYYNSFDGYYRSGIDGGRVDFDKDYGFTGTLELKPTEKLTATFRVSYVDNNDGQPPSSVIRNNAAPGIAAGSSVAPIPSIGFPGYSAPPRNLLYIGKVPAIPLTGPNVNTIALPFQLGQFGDREQTWRANATLNYEFDGATLTSLTAYDHRHADYTYDGDNTICDQPGGCRNFGFPFAPAIPVGQTQFALSSADITYRDVSQELRLASSGKRRFDWLVGFYFYDNRTNGIDRGPGALTAAGFANYSFPRQISTTQSYSGFGSVTWHASEAIALTGELRYEDEKQRFRQGSNNLASTAPAAVFDLSQRIHFWTPRVIAKYQPNRDHQVYASFARGEKEGGFNSGLNIFANQRSFAPEKTNTYEIGSKNDFLDHRLRVNGDVYYTDWYDQQAACQNPVSAGGSSTNRTYTCNVAASHIYGAELTVDLRLSDAVSIAGNYAYTHARYTTFLDASLAQTLVLAGLPPIDFNGKHLPYVPDHKFVISPRYNTQISDKLSFEARADVQYQSTTYLRADNLQNFGSKTLVDLRLTGRYERASLQVFVNNLFDNDRPVAGVRFFDSTNYSVSSPLIQGADRREIGATLGYRF